jgi:enterochelin esterase-like enzyme
MSYCRTITALLILFTLTAHAQDAAKKPSPDDQYVPGPDSKPQEGVPKGKVTKYTWNDSKIYPGTTRNYWVYVPAQYDGSTPACLWVCQDGIQYNAPVVFDNLIHKKQMPVTIGLFISPGDVPLKEGEAPRKRADGRPAGAKNRSVEYDTLSDTYARFLVEEMIPELKKNYKITDDPEGRAIGGGSSGGICAFTVAWERPDQFRKVFTTIGSFTDIRGGNKYPEIVSKSEKKPIRIYQQDGANDLNNQFGSWPEANKAMAAALKEKGYDHQFVFGEGVHSAKHGTMLFPDAMRWLWRDWPGVQAAK